MFIGQYPYSIDEKKRLAIPPKFRKLLGEKAVVTTGLDRCLFLLSSNEWEALAKKLTQLPLGQSDARGFSRLMLTGAMEVNFDNLGRILVPEYLKNYAQLKKRVMDIEKFLWLDKECCGQNNFPINNCKLSHKQ